VTKADIVSRVAAETGMTKTDVATVVEGVLSALSDAMVRGDRVEIRGFGVFKVVDRAPRVARNPRTGEAIPLPARKSPVFVPSRLLKRKVEESLK